MKRMGIFIFYDEAGIVDEYIEVLLSSMQDILERLVVIVNGNVWDEGYIKLKKYAQDIFVRENTGFDAGGYKDGFIKFMPQDDLKKWNEIVLFNDTFYGPFYPWKNMFDKMEKEKADFWGLSRHSGGEWEGRMISQHIQSFFLVCRKTMFLSDAWTEFWNGLEYPKTLREAIFNFEVRFSSFFSERQFIGKAWSDRYRVEIPFGKNPYSAYIFELIKEIEFPIIKNKTICLPYFTQMKKAFEYIAENTYYDINLISSHTKRLQKTGRLNVLFPFDMEEIEHFYNSHKKIFIYGCGNYGRGTALYFEYKGWKYEGFLVTVKTEGMENVFAFENIIIDAEDGVIIALGKKAFGEVYPYVRKSLAKSQLLLPKQ